MIVNQKCYVQELQGVLEWHTLGIVFARQCVFSDAVIKTWVTNELKNKISMTVKHSGKNEIEFSEADDLQFEARTILIKI